MQEEKRDTERERGWKKPTKYYLFIFISDAADYNDCDDDDGNNDESEWFILFFIIEFYMLAPSTVVVVVFFRVCLCLHY